MLTMEDGGGDPEMEGSLAVDMDIEPVGVGVGTGTRGRYWACMGWP